MKKRSPGGTVRVEVEEVTLSQAISFVLDEAGWRRAATNGGQHDHVVTDRVGCRGASVLLVPARPVPCREALLALGEGRVRAVLASDDVSGLPDALAALESGVCTVPVRIIDAAREVPVLSERQHHLVAGIVAGRTNRTLARQLQVSEATIKREMSELLRRFDVPNRMALAATVVRLGFGWVPTAA